MDGDREVYIFKMHRKGGKIHLELGFWNILSSVNADSWVEAFLIDN